MILRRHTLFAQISAALAFTPAIGPLIGGVVDQFWGFRAVFFGLVIMSLFVFSYAYFSLGETYDVKQRSKVKLLPIVNRFLKNQPTLIYGFLIGTINGILFSYYAEAPFIFIEYFHFSTATYGFLGMIVAVASILGSLLSKRLVISRQPEKIILDGIKIMLVGISIILAVSVSTFFASEWQWFMLLVGVFITLLGTGTALPNCLSLALVDFQDVIGSAGGLFSLGYYLLVSVVTFGMSFVHNGTLWAMPCYFLLIGLIMLKLAKKLTNN